jgi:hypothetical protein
MLPPNFLRVPAGILRLLIVKEPYVMPIMSFNEFKGRTDKTGCSRSSLIHVDIALQDYCDGNNATEERQIELVSVLISACGKWLKIKSKKNTELVERRRRAVSKLGNQALDELYNLNEDLVGEIRFTRAKIKTLSGRRSYGTTSLSPGYWHERTAYIKSGKTYAPSGSDLSGIYKTIGSFNPLPPKKYLKLVNKKRFEELSLQDFLALHEVGKSEGFGKTVNFLKKGDRMLYLAIPTGKRFHDIHNKPLNTEGENAYAIDSYGNMFTKRVSMFQGNVFFNHSSFNAGKDVISAGMIKFERGYLREIDNNSGHYKPTRDNLHEAIRLFDEDGIDLQYAAVLVHEFFNEEEIIFAYKAETFRDNQYADDFAVVENQKVLNKFLRKLPQPPED